MEGTVLMPAGTMAETVPALDRAVTAVICLKAVAGLETASI